MAKKTDGNFGNIKSFHSFVPGLTTMGVKTRILQKAHDLYMRYGIRSVTMDEIALQAGVSKKTIYQFFEDKDALVEAIVLEKIKFAQQCCDQDKEAARNAVEEIFRTMQMMEEMFRNMNPAVMFDLQKHHPLAFSKFEKHKSEYVYNIIRQNLVRGIEEGLYREEINIDIIALYRVETMLILFNPVFQFKGTYNIADIEKEIVLHYLFGIASPKGYKLILKYQLDRNKKTNKYEKIKTK
jgi:AcrR family transcriptional regulator